MPVYRILLTTIALAALGGCSEMSLNPASRNALDTTASITPQQTKYHSSDEDVQAGLKHFSEGAFALAQERFEKGVAQSPRDLTAWVGLAATYDRLRRFDLADRAYEHAVKIGGVNVTILNNRGYSYLLRGDVVNARKMFTQAYAIDPANATVSNNLHLLDGSRKHVRRVEAAY